MRRPDVDAVFADDLAHFLKGFSPDAGPINGPAGAVWITSKFFFRDNWRIRPDTFTVNAFCVLRAVINALTVNADGARRARHT